MKNTTNEKTTQSDLLMISYCENRMRLKAISDEIKVLLSEFPNIDLSEYRKYWLERNGWLGWEIALDVDEYEPNDMKLAKLLDKKAIIREDAGNIKRAIYNRGKSLLANAKLMEPERASEPN